MIKRYAYLKKKPTILFMYILLTIFLAACQQNADNTQEVTTMKNLEKKVEKKAEKYRPNFHFTPPEKWMNDPNGMVYYEGEYHLFYQYYPDDIVWGPMHWGHAISKDLIHWEHLPIALYPDSLGYIFSGSAVVDVNNTSGFGKNNQPPLIAIFTYHDPMGEKKKEITYQYQAIAYSNDKGRTWTKYEGNPVIPNPGIKDFRDPKVIWDKHSNQWIMVFAAFDHSKFYGSPNLIDWTHLSDWGKEYGAHGGVWECPDIFPMTVEGTSEEKWVLLQSLNPGGPNGGSATQYFVGDFDGKEFIADKEFATQDAFWIDYGRDNYAGVTWSNAPEGRRIFLGWMSNWDYAQKVPTATWRSAMTVARDLSLQKTPQGLRLFSKPITTLDKLRVSKTSIASQSGDNMVINLKNPQGASSIELELEIAIPLGDTTKFIIEAANAKGEKYQIGYDAASNQYFSDRRQSGLVDFSDNFANAVHTAPRTSNESSISLHLLIDITSAELFADKGQTAVTEIFFPSEYFTQFRLLTKDGTAKILGGHFYTLK